MKKISKIMFYLLFLVDRKVPKAKIDQIINDEIKCLTDEEIYIKRLSNALNYVFNNVNQILSKIRKISNAKIYFLGFYNIYDNKEIDNKIIYTNYKIENLYIYDEAELETEPYNINHTKDILIFAVIGIVISFGYVLIANMLDTTIKSVQDIEKTSGVTVLASIPVYDIGENRNKSKRGGKR